MTGELTLDAQNSPILAFFDFLVPEGDLGCSEQASKTLVKKNFWVFFFLTPVSHMILISMDTHEKEFRAIHRTR